MTLELSAWVAVPAAVLLICGGLLTLIGSSGPAALARLLRTHALAYHGRDAGHGLRAGRLDAGVVGGHWGGR